MNNAFRWIYNTLRAIIMIVVVLLVVAYAALYLGVSMPYFQNKIKAVAEREASKFLETDVTIDGVSISPFNQVILTGVKIPDQSGGDLIKVDKVGAGVSLYDLVVRQKIIFNFAEIDGLHGTVTRPDKNSPTNLQFIIDKFKPKPDQPPKPYDIRINNAILRNCDLAYDVLNEPCKATGRFDPNHIKVTDLTADLVFPRIKNNDFIIDVNRLAFNEQNGLELKKLSGKFKVDDTRAQISNLVVELPGTRLAPSNTTFHYSSLKNAINEIKVAPLDLKMEDNYITPADLKTFEPKLAQLNEPIHFTVDASSTFDKLDVRQLNVKTNGLDLDVAGDVTNYRSSSALAMNFRHIDLNASGSELSHLTHALAKLPPNVQNLIDKSGDIKLSGKNLSTDMQRDNLLVENLNLNLNHGGVKLDLSGNFQNLRNTKELQYDIKNIDLTTQASTVKQLAQTFTNLPPRVQQLLDKSGNIKINGTAAGNLNELTAKTQINTALGDVDFDGEYFGGNQRKVNGHIKTRDLALGTIIDKPDLLGSVTADATIDGTILPDNSLVATLKGDVEHIDLKGYRYHNIKADVTVDHNNYDGTLAINDPNGKVDLVGKALIDGANSSYDFNLVAQNLNLAKMNITTKYPASALNVKMQGNVKGNDLNSLAGNVTVDDVSFINSNTGKGFHMSNFTLDAKRDGYPQHIEVNTDFLHGSVNGSFDFNTIVPAVKSIAAKCFPQFMSGHTPPTNGANDFTFNFVIEPNEEFESFVSSYAKLPVKLIYKATVDGQFSERNNTLNANVNLPYLQQGNKIIEGTTLHVAKNENSDNVMMSAHTIFPNKKGNIALNIDANAVNDCVDANLNWVFNRETDYHGNINLSALLGRDSNGKFMTSVNINPTQVVVNDTVWNVQQGSFKYENGMFDVDQIEGSCDDQFIKIAGKVSHDPDDELKVSLQNIHLDYIFETLKINHVTFGGVATGEVMVADVFSGNPRLSTAPKLHVDNLHYNGAAMGDAEIESHFDSENTGVVLGCDLTQSNGRHTYINGEIFAGSDSLYLEFDADKANVEFMKPFMEAFTEEVHGLVSGQAVLFGNFKTIDLMGDIYAEDFSLKVGYTNTTYSCTDSVHIRPGLIQFSDITINDRDKNTAKLRGWLKHDAFHNPEFNFTVTDARNLLCYDITPAMNPDWYGTIYGNGSAIIAGEPGEVRIGVNMESASRSKFTFVLSDREDAGEYNFITFRDRDKKDLPLAVNDTVAIHNDTVPEIVRQLAKKIEDKQQQQSSPTHFSIDLQVDITPEAEIILVMDPVGGDRIRAFGAGNLRINYNSIDDAFDMFGKYTLQKGSYNFTLQDIILKDFTIRDGSTISFDGDPYNAILDINAVYSLNANLSDLDDSFSTDRDINRTNVPVNALLMVKGGISEPELSFDLEFPTLSSDVYRKIKSVISTDEMMNRQIIYLLALNRFYTPDYMQASKNNNELTSVASSTISSQLSNMLGQISENWQISPNFRSDKGDFSDVEVNLALSSQLLNNRLIFNGNFGYRDNTYNTRNSNFIGDFDLEYLLNRKGTIRLKAYNHFNDQNYYVRDAMTTQGVGVVFKHDFDRLFNKKQPAQAPDSTIVPFNEPADTLLRFSSRKSVANDSVIK
jgi:hypothetical protein